MNRAVAEGITAGFEPQRDECGLMGNGAQSKQRDASSRHEIRDFSCEIMVALTYFTWLRFVFRRQALNRIGNTALHELQVIIYKGRALMIGKSEFV